MLVALEELRELWRNAPELSLATRSLPPVVEEVFARTGSNRWYDESFHLERRRLAASRDLDSPPKRLDRVERFGYDAQGRLVVGERYSKDSPGETVVVHRANEADGGVTELQFAYDSAWRDPVGSVRCL